MITKIAPILLLAVASGVSAQSAPSKPKADIIFTHGNIYTGVVDTTASLGAGKRSEALAIIGDRIVAVGARDEVMKMKGPDTKIVDLDGRFVMPGFNDAHMHLASAGLEKMNVNLVGSKTLDEFRDRLRAKCDAAGPGEWVVGEGWDETLWPVKVVPTRWDLDEVSGKHPVYLERVDGHIGVANTRALQLASVTVASKDPDGGKIDRDDSGTPNGILREKAQDLVQSVIPKPTHEKRTEAIKLALEDMASHGITSAQDFSQWEDFEIYEGLGGPVHRPPRRAVGLPKSSVHALFGSKQELQLATINAARDSFITEVAGPALSSTGPGRERLLALCEGYLSYVERRVFPGGAFFDASAEVGAQAGRVHDEVARIQQQWRDLLAAEARAAADNCELPDGTDAAQLAFELGVILAGTDLVSVLHDDLHVISRARTAIRTRLAG